MKREINNHKKADLEKVLCDNWICFERGDFPRCYLDVYKNCMKYISLVEYNKREKKNK